jgi:glycosyltransferase involved in cell wall biosynthesis
LNTKHKVIRTSTISASLNYLLKGQLAFLNDHYDVLAVSGEDIDLKEVRIREGVKTFSIQIQRKISPVQDLISLWKLYVLFKKEKPLIVHSITPKAGLLSMVAAKFACVPIRVHTFTGLIFPSKTGLLKRILIIMDKLLCYCATNVYPEGLGVSNDLIAYKITKKPLKVIANGNVNGIDISYFDSELISSEEKQSLKANLGITPKDFVFIFVGRLVGDKGINELITSFEMLSNDVNNTIQTKLLLIGSFEMHLDPLASDTLQKIRDNKNIIHAGFQLDVRSYFSISDCLVFPSYREGFPNVVMQAGAMGVPSIVTNINGCNEIIIEGKNGTIIPVKDVNLLFKAMKKMKGDNIYRTHLQKNSRVMIVSRYEQQMVWEAILREYKRLEKKCIE